MTRGDVVSSEGSKGSPPAAFTKMQWRGRDAIRLANDTVELISLTGGGHLASLRFLHREGRLAQNVLWEAPWPTIDPTAQWSENLERFYGPVEIGKYLAGYTGHAVCLDYFGEPPSHAATLGLSLHGEAAVISWSVGSPAASQLAGARWEVKLPFAQLAFEREIYLAATECVAYVDEAVSSKRDSEHVFDWVQHVTFGPPFLRSDESTVASSARRGITAASSYEGRSLLAAGREFEWPYAPRNQVNAVADLRRPFDAAGRGFLAGLQLDTTREQEFIVAVNWASRLGVGYCFRRRDFPWMTVWEENQTRLGTPWLGRTQARGMEFCTTPLPLGKHEARQTGSMFGSPTGCVLPARGRIGTKYLIFLFEVPQQVRSIGNVVVVGDAIELSDENGAALFSIPAEGCEAFLADHSRQNQQTNRE
jgi:hypothetical protein